MKDQRSLNSDHCMQNMTTEDALKQAQSDLESMVEPIILLNST